jgi:hypothetical protein
MRDGQVELGKESSMKLISGLMVGVMVATTCSGCYSTWDIAPQELTKLNGYREPQKVPLADQEGSELEFDRRTELSFYTAEGATQDKAKFSAIDVNGTVLSGAARGAPRTVNVDLATLSNVEARRFSVGKTVAAGAIPLGVLTVAITVLYVVAITNATRN